MKVLVTGSSGYLGRHFCKALRAHNHQVTEVNTSNCDLTEDGSLNQFNTEKYDMIFHFAVYIQAGDFPMRHPGDIWIINQKMNTHLLAWWKDCQPQAKLISIGTSCAYPVGTNLKEVDYLNGMPHSTLAAYAITKRALYVGLQSLHDQYGLNYLCFGTSALYGTDYKNRGKQSHFIFDLIRKIIDAERGGPAPVLWGDGYQTRELSYVGDFVKAMLLLAPTQKNIMINVGTGVEYSIRHFAEAICKIVGYDSNLIEYDTTKYVGATAKCLNNERFKEILPNFEFTPLEEGLKTTIDWYMDAHSLTH